MKLKRLAIIIITALFFCQQAIALRADSLMLERMFHYAQAIQDKRHTNHTNYNYTRFALDVERKNFSLLAIPTMFAIANTGQRLFVDESYNIVYNYGSPDMRSKTLLRNTTIPHRKMAMENILKYLTPQIYHETIIDDYIISPFSLTNKRFYKYNVTFLNDDKAEVTFSPRRKNTQLVSGNAIIDYYTGRVMECYLGGEYDMVDFGLTLTMGDEYRHSLLPSKVILDSDFSFLSNKISGRYVSYYDLPKTDSISSPEQMAELRPDTLSEKERTVIEKFMQKKARTDTVNKRKKKYKLLENIGDNVLNRIRQNFGNDGKGYIRIDPILNPLYLGYSKRRGITYKFDFRARYMFSANSDLAARLKAGYSFKQRQLYLNIPLTWQFNKQSNGYTRIEFGNGNHVGNSMLAQRMQELMPDSVTDWQTSTMNDFRNNYMKFYTHIDITPHVEITGGLSIHRRKAVNIAAYKKLSQRYTYHSSAPTLEIRLSPWLSQGPCLTIDYERSIKGLFNANISYERWELNSEYIYRQNKLQSLHLRFGTGFYTTKDKNGYFLDFANFRENTVPGGWNDDWSGEFELLSGNTYNRSDYYIRANATYESPLLILSWLPCVGKYMEMERMHVSTLDVKGIHPYIETGYGFTTRWFSAGVFVAFNQWEFDAVGIKWGFELFRKW